MHLLSFLRGDTNAPIHQERTIHQLLDRLLAQDAQLGKQVALMQIDGHQITFNELNQRADQMAHQLAASIVKEPSISESDRIVAVCLPHSIDLIVGLLAIFKSGSAYLPLDVNFPPDRVNHILQDSKPNLLLTSGSVLKSSPTFASVVQDNGVPIFDVETNQLDSSTEEPLIHQQERTLAAVLYTSGSTGIPKGVRLEHKTILHRLNWQWRTFPYAADEIGCCKTALTFVDSIAEIWGPLLAGKPLQLVPKDVTQDTERFIDLLNLCKVTRLVLVPSLLKAILTILKSRQTGEPSLSKLKMWICSGEVLTSQLLLEFYDVFPAGTIMCNFYGSTEVMGDVTYVAFDSSNQVTASLIDNKVPIGKVVDNCVIYLLDPTKEPVESGEVGEIYVAGAHLCSGYVNNREAERFIPNHIENASGYEKMFRTGDYGRIVDGQIYYEGRADSQVKIRGHRVDLNEIITAVNRVEQVSFGTVLCYKAGEPEQEVVAFIALKPTGQIEVVRNELKGKLVSYMMPKVVQIDEVPLLVNGKVDRQKLLRLFADQHQSRMNTDHLWNEDQLTKEEKVLLKTIVSVTGGGSRPLKLTDNFFDIGGNSLNAVAVVTKLRDQGYFIDISSFLAAESLAQLVPKLNKSNCGIVPSACESQLISSTYTMELLQPSFKEEVVKIIGKSFSQKEILAVLAGAGYQDFEAFFDEVWEALVAANLSFVLKDQGGNIMSVAVNMDLFDEDTIDPTKVSQELSTIFEFLDSLEAPIKEKHFIEKKTNLVLNNFMMATVQTATPAENVALIQQMEMENIKLARRRGFQANMTTNTIELTRQVCEDLLDYKALCEYQINQYVAPDGSKPFGDASDSTLVTISVRYNNN